LAETIALWLELGKGERRIYGSRTEARGDEVGEFPMKSGHGEATSYLFVSAQLAELRSRRRRYPHRRRDTTIKYSEGVAGTSSFIHSVTESQQLKSWGRLAAIGRINISYKIDFNLTNLANNFFT
jgi:hypothetical protein